MSKAGIPTRHRLRRKYNNGRGLVWMQGACSCGWIGNKYYVEGQLTDVQREEAKHLLEAERLENQDEDQ